MALLSLHEQTAFGGIYSRLREVTLLERDEQKAWPEIRQLESLSDVDPLTRVSVRSALVQAKLLNWNIRVDLEQPIAWAKKIGIVCDLKPRTASPSICLPLSTPRGEAIRRVQAFFGDNFGEP